MSKLNSDILALLAKVEEFTSARTVIGTVARDNAAMAEIFLLRARRSLRTDRKFNYLRMALVSYRAAKLAA